jgi:hypothetical protein
MSDKIPPVVVGEEDLFLLLKHAINSSRTAKLWHQLYGGLLLVEKYAEFLSPDNLGELRDYVSLIATSEKEVSGRYRAFKGIQTKLKKLAPLPKGP